MNGVSLKLTTQSFCKIKSLFASTIFYCQSTIFLSNTPQNILPCICKTERGKLPSKCMLWDYNIEPFYFTFLFLYSYSCILTTMVFSFVIIICNALNSFHVLKNCHCLLQQRNWFCLQVLSAIDYSGSNCFLDAFWSLTLIFMSKIFPCCVREQYFTKTVFLALSVAEQNKTNVLQHL